MNAKINIEITKEYYDYSNILMGYNVAIKSEGIVINVAAYAFEKTDNTFSIYCEETLPIFNESVIDIDLKENDVDFKVIWSKGTCKKVVKDYKNK